MNIEFRGLATIGIEVMIYGDLLRYGSYTSIRYDAGSDTEPKYIEVPVDPSSVGQYTGIKDKNGVKVFSGDILYCHEYDSSDCGKKITQTFRNAVVGFDKGSFYYYPKGNMNQPHQLLIFAYEPVIIGNIHQHPELLKKS